MSNANKHSGYEYEIDRVSGMELHQIREIKERAERGWRLVAATPQLLYFERPIQGPPR